MKKLFLKICFNRLVRPHLSKLVEEVVHWCSWGEKNKIRNYTYDFGMWLWDKLGRPLFYVPEDYVDEYIRRRCLQNNEKVTS